MKKTNTTVRNNGIGKEKKFTSSPLILIFSFLVIMLNLISTFKVPYTGDDRMNSLTRGALLYNGLSVFEHTGQIASMWMKGGRFFPLGFYSYGLFNLLTDLFSYRLFLLCLNLITVAVFSFLVYEITSQKYVVCFSVTMTSVFFQFRDYHDAILGFHGLLQFVSIFVFLSVLFQIKSIQKEKYRYGVVSGIFFFISLLMYEVAYSFVAVFLLVPLLYCKSWRHRIKIVIPQFTAVIAGLVPTFYLRTKAEFAMYSGTEFSFEPLLILKTFLKQFTAGIPLSYMKIIYPYGIENGKNIMGYISAYQFILLAIFFITVLLCFIYFTRNEFTSIRQVKLSNKSHQKIRFHFHSSNLSRNQCWERNLFLIGFAIAAAPAGILSLSSRYQKELQWGIGYLPVYIQNYGGVCMTAAACFYLIRFFPKCLVRRMIITIIIGGGTIVLYFTLLINQMTIDKINRIAIQPVSNLALSSGLLDGAEENIRFLVIQGGLGPELDPQNFVAQYANGLKINPINIEQLLGEKSSVNEDIITLFPENVYGFHVVGTLENGLALFFQIDSLDYSNEDQSILQIYTTHMLCFYISRENKTNLYLPRLDKNGAMYACYIQISDLRNSESEASILLDSGDVFVPDPLYGNGLALQRISDVIPAPEGFRKCFLLDQGDGFLFEIKSEEFPILIRGIGLVG